MKELIQILENRVLAESSNLSNNNTDYIAGLADALEIVKEYDKSQLVIGRKYYVLLYDNIHKKANIEQMTLYRINKKEKTSYCFCRNYNQPTPDLVLYSKASLKLRVFNNLESAKNGIQLFLVSLRSNIYG